MIAAVRRSGGERRESEAKKEVSGLQCQFTRLVELLALPVSHLILVRFGQFLALYPSTGFLTLEKKVG